MMKRLASLLAALMIGTVSAYASDRPVVVELYTSQGCSSCPPADAFFQNELAGRDDVIALALHVDYWDYIGWKDKFADPAFSDRQRSYARAAGHRTVYTPQMIIGGLDHVVGTHPKEVRAHLKSHAAADTPVRISAERKGNRLAIALSANEPLAKPMVVQLVRYKDMETVAIRRGENAGRTLSYSNIVTDWDVVGEWDTRRDRKMTARIPGEGPLVVIVQQKGFGPIEAALRLR